MTVLYKNRQLAVTTIRDLLSMTDGNLASHLYKLEEVGYVKTGRVLAGLTFEVQAKITDAGSRAFRGYLAQLRRLVEDVAPGDPERAL